MLFRPKNLMLVLVVALVTASPCLSAPKKVQEQESCLTSAFRSAAEGKVLSPPSVSMLETAWSDAEMNSSRDLTREVKSVREHAVPNGAYARAHPEKSYVDVVKVGNLKHAYLAIFNHSVYMDWAVGRITTFQTQNRIVSDNALFRSNSEAQGFGGHDLPADLSRDFEKEFLKQNPVHASSPKAQVELDFWTNVMLPLLKTDPKATVISGAIDYRPNKVLSHELLHANFYERPDLQKKVGQFWEEELSASDRKQYLKIFRDEKYDLGNQMQIMNEFLAYTLEEDNAKVYPKVFPRKLISKYQARLRSYLHAADIEIPRMVILNH
jgi:hypothetical protein